MMSQRCLVHSLSISTLFENTGRGLGALYPFPLAEMPHSSFFLSWPSLVDGGPARWSLGGSLGRGL